MTITNDKKIIQENSFHASERIHAHDLNFRLMLFSIERRTLDAFPAIAMPLPGSNSTAEARIHAWAN